MKKLYGTIMLILLLALCVTMLTACENSLSAPSGLVLDVQTQTLQWNLVKNAAFYTVQISGQEEQITTKMNKVSLEDLEPGDYQIRIKANGGDAAFKDSEWVSYQFTRVAESGLKYKLTDNGNAYELVSAGTASGDVVMEDVFRGKPVVAIADKALYSNENITGFTVGKNVKTIGDKAFGKCVNLTKVTIPEGVTSLGRYAFQSCKNLASVSLPDSITEIAPYTFAWCSAITDVTVGQRLTTIGEYAFSDCGVLESISYQGSSGGMKAALPDTVEHIGAYAFADCKALTEMDVGGAQSIDEGAFMGNKMLGRLELGERLQTIGTSAFYGCEKLTAVAIPDSTQTIGNKVFMACTELNDVTLGVNVKSIGKDAFTDTAIMANARQMLVISGWLIRYLDEKSEKLTITADIKGIASYAAYGMTNLVQADIKGVKYVNMAAFAGCTDLYRVTFDDALLELGNYAFYGCSFLLNVSLGNSITSIGSYAFQYCSKLADLTIPKTVTFVGARAFRNTPVFNNMNLLTGGVVYMDGWAVDYIPSAYSALMGGVDLTAMLEEGTRGIASYTFSYRGILYVTLPESLEYICKGAFYNFKSYSINIPSAVKYIGDYAFYCCETANFGGTSYALTIPESTTYIGRSAFYGCKNVVSVTIPGSVTYIGPYAFYDCSNLGALVEAEIATEEQDENGNPVMQKITLDGQLILHEGVQTIGDRAFQNCEGLRAVAIPDSVTQLGTHVFYNCRKLQTATLGSGISQLSAYTFYNCEALEEVNVSQQLENIGNYAFRGCAALREMDLKMVQSIGKYSFYGCSSLTALVLPQTLRTVGDYAFRGCAGVTAVVIPGEVARIGKHAFYGLKNATLYLAAADMQEQWQTSFNSSYRPTFWGCLLSADGSYVVAVTVGENTLSNPYATNGMGAPVREGYTFAGWTTEQGGTVAEYTMDTVMDAPEGTVLYAIWA